MADFFELGTDRQLTAHGAGPIPAASICRHTDGWPDEEADMFRRVIRALDTAWLKSQLPDADMPETDNAVRDGFRARMR